MYLITRKLSLMLKQHHRLKIEAAAGPQLITRLHFQHQ